MKIAYSAIAFLSRLAFAGISLMAVTYAETAPTPAPVAEAISKMKLPGIEINAAERYVDVEATICLEKGYLELIACTKGSKEHESIITVEALPKHIHVALLLLGAKNGTPASRRMLDEETREWQEIPPQGDSIDLSLVWKNPDGKWIERSISDFVSHKDAQNPPPAAEPKKPAVEKFPSTFLFAGSLLGDAGKRPRDYLADKSGHVVSISTYGDELLCLPGFQSQDNGALAWKVNSQNIPKLGTKVTLRLRLQKQPKPH